MPPPYGVTDNGFNAKTQEEIKADLEAGYRGVFGAGVNLEPSESTFGVEIGIMSERLAEVWQAAQAAYNAAFPDGSTGVSLVNVGSITGIAKLPATHSKVIETCYGPQTGAFPAPGSTLTVPAGSQLSVIGTGVKFRNAVDLVSAAATGANYLSVSGEFVAVLTGPLVAPAGSLTVIDTPVVGLDHVSNAADQFLKGTDLETDPAFRMRRERSLRGLGNNSPEAIAAKVRAVANVTDCAVFSNLTESTDVNGLPPHSFEVVVAGGLDADIAQVIQDSRANSRTYGTTIANALDAAGHTQLIGFSRPAAKNIYVTINVKVINVNTFTAASIALIKTRIAGAVRATGESVSASSLLALIDTGDIPGIVEFPTLPLISFTVTPTVSTTLVLTNHQKAAFDTSRVVVTLS